MLHKSERKNQPSVNQLLKSIRMSKADRNNSSNSLVCNKDLRSAGGPGSHRNLNKEIQQKCFKLCAAYTRTEILNLV